MDTGAWFAFFNAADPDHEAVAQVLEGWEGRLVTSDYAFNELLTPLRYRVTHKTACTAGEALRSTEVAALVSVERSDFDEAWRTFSRERDKRYSFTDCTSFALMKRLDLTTAAAVDPDFRRAGFRVLPE